MKEKIIDIVLDIIAFFVILFWVLYVHIKFLVLEPKSAFKEIKKIIFRKK